MWGFVKPHHRKGRLISDSSSRKLTTRFQYVGDRRHSCSLKIKKSFKLMQADTFVPQTQQTCSLRTETGAPRLNVSTGHN